VDAAARQRRIGQENQEKSKSVNFPLTFLAVRLLAGALFAAEQPVAKTPAATPRLEPVRISADGKHFELGGAGARFKPWGFNYLGEEGTLLEEYWADKWPAIEEDFREMKKLGANVIRVHLQLSVYMSAADQTRAEELKRLRRLLDLAQDCGLYLDLTGLGCYRLAQVPKWYDELDEAGRWDVQARFWRAIAETCKGQPAVFCYSLMNEPVIGAAKAGEPPWLTGELGGFHFVQRISTQPGKRTQTEIAAAWVERLTKAIREIDPDHLITVGVIPWAQIWPGAKPIFYAPGAAKHLDFVSVHFYPKAGKVKETLTALKVYDIGKPMVVEETFPLSCSLAELAEFMQGADGIVEGWISHYFGKTIAEHRKQKDMKNAIIAEFLEFWKTKAPAH
jgi:Cellulase (glycosyl hydrolase family 5)